MTPESGPIRIANRPDPKVFALFRLRFARCVLEIARFEGPYAQKIGGREFVPNFVQFLSGENGADGAVRDDIMANYPRDAAELEALLRTSDFFRKDVPYRRVMNLLYYGLRSPASAKVLRSFAAGPCLEVLRDMKIGMLLSEFPDIYDAFVNGGIGKSGQSGGFYPNIVKRGAAIAKWVGMIRGKSPSYMSGFANLLKAEGLRPAFQAADEVAALHGFWDRQAWPPAVLEYWRMFCKIEAGIEKYIGLYDELYKNGGERGNLQNVNGRHADGPLRHADMEIIEDMGNMNNLTPIVARQILEWARDGRLYAPAPFMPPAVVPSVPRAARRAMPEEIFRSRNAGR